MSVAQTRVFEFWIGVALARPPAVHEYRKYLVAGKDPVDALQAALQMASCTCVMPVHSSPVQRIL